MIHIFDINDELSNPDHQLGAEIAMTRLAEVAYSPAHHEVWMDANGYWLVDRAVDLDLKGKPTQEPSKMVHRFGMKPADPDRLWDWRRVWPLTS